MTSIVGIRSKNGVVIAADSAATFGDGGQVRTIEQSTQKIDIIGGKIIVVGTGFVGHQQRFSSTVKDLWDQKKLGGGASAIDIARTLSQAGVNDFAKTTPGPMMNRIPYSALVAYPAKDEANLCELAGQIAFQPELKEPAKLWWASNGSGQPITDPFLALLRKVFWPDTPPDVQGGKFMAMWALMHACELNPGGIKEPISMATLAVEKSSLTARLLDEAELQELRDIVGDAMKHMASFRDVLEGRGLAANAPAPPPQAAVKV